LVLKEALIKSFDTKQKVGEKHTKWVKLADGYEGVKTTPRQQEVVSLLEGVGEASVKEICYFTGVTASVIETLIKNGALIAFEKQIFRTPIRMKVAKNSKKIVLTDEQQKAFEGLFGDFLDDNGKVSLLYGITGSGKTQVFLSLADEVVARGKALSLWCPKFPLLLNSFLFSPLVTAIRLPFSIALCLWDSVWTNGKELKRAELLLQ
jgi:primosomal protein N' (replication factor Y)